MEPEQNGQAGTNLAIVILVLVIVVVGVKLLMSSSPAGVPAEEDVASETATSTEDSGEIASDMMPILPEEGVEPVKEMVVTPVAPVAGVGKGMVAFSVSSNQAVNVLGISVRNPWRTAEESGGWIKIYEGYKAIPANGAAEVYTVSLAAITYDKVRVRTISEETGETAEAEQDMQIEVKSGEKIGKLIAL